jgi:hypothetical protein
MIGDSTSHLPSVIMFFIVILIVLCSLIALAFQKDVRALMIRHEPEHP